MFISIQFPIVDLRPLQGVPLIPLPFWNVEPRAFEKFIHFFGEVRQRKTISAKEIPFEDELFYVTAKRALRFPALEKQQIGSLKVPQGACRRLYCEPSEVVTRVEIGIESLTSNASGLDARECLAVLGEFLSLHTKVAHLPHPQNDDSEKRKKCRIIQIPLHQAGDALANVYLLGTTKKTISPNKHAISTGEPLVFLNYKSSEIQELPEKAMRVDCSKVQGASVAYMRYQRHARDLGVWLVEPGKADGKDLRNLRIGLGKLHAEHQAIREVLRALKEKTLLPSEALSGFLKASLGRLTEPKKYGIDQQAISSIIDAYDVAYPEERTLLKNNVTKALDFDVFLCYNSSDKDAVRDIDRQLRKVGINTWFDEEQLVPGNKWLNELMRQIKTIKSVAVFVGESGMGPWQRKEISEFLTRYGTMKFPIIPILLKGTTNKPSLPPSIKDFTWVDFRQEAPPPLGRLVKAISGVDW